MSVKRLKRPRIVSSSQGLICFYSFCGLRGLVLWNSSIRKSMSVSMPHVLICPYQTFVGFAVCPKTIEPKLVKISFINHPTHFGWVTRIPSQVEVYTLSSRVWRTLSSSNMPSVHVSIALRGNQVVIDGFIYWHVMDWINVKNDDDPELHFHNLIMSFNITSEEFIEVYLPIGLAHLSYFDLSISKLKESLVVLECIVTSEHGVWMMERGVPNSFTKLFVINPTGLLISDIYGFRESGQPIFGMTNGDVVKLCVYEPSSEPIIYIGIHGYEQPWFVSSYIETLLLLNH